MVTKKDLTVKMDIGDEWQADLRWAKDRTAEGPQEITIRPKVPGTLPGHGLSSTILRAVNINVAHMQLRTQLPDPPEIWRDTSGELNLGEVAAGILRQEGVTDTYLSFLAAYYAELISKQEELEGSPLEGLRRAFEGRTAVNTLRGHMWQARKRGLLEGGSSGRAGGELTEKAGQLIRAHLTKKPAGTE